jgi:hypothetical protein
VNGLRIGSGSGLFDLDSSGMSVLQVGTDCSEFNKTNRWSCFEAWQRLISTGEELLSSLESNVSFFDRSDWVHVRLNSKVFLESVHLYRLLLAFGAEIA